MAWVAVGTAVVGAGTAYYNSENAPKFKSQLMPTLADLTEDARAVFRDNQSGLLEDQLAAQKGNFGEFFDIQQDTVKRGKSLIDKLTTGDFERRLATANIRGAQSARGLSLSPAAAIQEGLAVGQAQQQSEFAALGLGQDLARFSAETPLQLQQMDFSQLLGTQSQMMMAQQGFAVDAQISNINMKRDVQTANMGILGRVLGSFGQGEGTSDKKTYPGNVIGTTQGGGGGGLPQQDFSGRNLDGMFGGAYGGGISNTLGGGGGFSAGGGIEGGSSAANFQSEWQGFNNA